MRHLFTDDGEVSETEDDNEAVTAVTNATYNASDNLASEEQTLDQAGSSSTVLVLGASTSKKDSNKVEEAIRSDTASTADLQHAVVEDQAVYEAAAELDTAAEEFLSAIASESSPNESD